MRSILYINRKPALMNLWTILSEGDLVVVPTEEWAELGRKQLRWKIKCLKDLIEADPTINANQARNQSVEFRTQAEMEQVDINEKLAMEVL